MSADAANILARIRAAGLTVAPDAADPGKVYVTPRDRLTDELRAIIRANKAALLAELAKAPAVCGSCAHYQNAPDGTKAGGCARHRVETWSDLADGCAGDWTPTYPAARELERRRARVVADLEAHPEARYAFDVQGAPLTGPASSPVSVMLGLRDSSGQIITGELTIPADRWPGIAIFSEYWRMAAEGTPS